MKTDHLISNQVYNVSIQHQRKSEEDKENLKDVRFTLTVYSQRKIQITEYEEKLKFKHDVNDLCR
jgi:hypothetical protein